MSVVGARCSSRRAGRSGPVARASSPQRDRAAARTAAGTSSESSHVLDEEAVLVDGVERASRLRSAELRPHHQTHEQVRRSRAGRARAEDHDALVGHRHAGRRDRGEQRAGRDRRGALDVVVEACRGDRDSDRAAGRRWPWRSPPTGGARSASAAARRRRTPRRSRRSPARGRAGAASRRRADRRGAPRCRCRRRAGSAASSTGGYRAHAV